MRSRRGSNACSSRSTPTACSIRETGLLTRESFWRDLDKAVAEAGDRSQALSLARFSFDGALDARASMDGARLMTRLIRNIDFACRDDDGSILIAFTQTDLRSAHVVARRIAGALKNTMLAPQRGRDKIAANVTLATLKAGDTLDTPDAARDGQPGGCRRVSRTIRLAPNRSEPCPTNQPVRIDVVSDVVCPWCFIGKRRLEKALALQARHCGRGALAPLFSQ